MSQVQSLQYAWVSQAQTLIKESLMSLKLNVIIGIVSLGVGFGLGYKSIDRSPVIETKVVTKTKIIKVTKPSGEKIETITQELVQSDNIQTASEHKKYSVSLFRNYDFSRQVDNYEIGLNRYLGLGFSLGIKVNNQNQIGLGLLKEF